MAAVFWIHICAIIPRSMVLPKSTISALQLQQSFQSSSTLSPRSTSHPIQCSTNNFCEWCARWYLIQFKRHHLVLLSLASGVSVLVTQVLGSPPFRPSTEYRMKFTSNNFRNFLFQRSYNIYSSLSLIFLLVIIISFIILCRFFSLTGRHPSVFG